MDLELTILFSAMLILTGIIVFWLTKLLSCVPQVNPDESIDELYEETEFDNMESK